MEPKFKVGQFVEFQSDNAHNERYNGAIGYVVNVYEPALAGRSYRYGLRWLVGPKLPGLFNFDNDPDQGTKEDGYPESLLHEIPAAEGIEAER